MGKYLNGDGVGHFWLVIKSWVQNQGFITSADIPEGAAASSVTPQMDGTAAKGTDNGFARGDHVHPSDTNKQDVIDSSHKLSADLISDGTTNKVYTATEQSKLANISAGAEVNVVSSVNTTAGTSGINLSLTSGALDVTISSGSVENNNTNFVTGGTVYNTTKDLAPKASPEFSGTPTAPTVSTASDNSTKIATTAFVQSAISAASSGAAVFKGVVDAGSAISGLTAYSSGWYWVVGTAGTYVGENCEVGDFIFCVSNYSSAYSASDFSVVQNNIEALSDNDIDDAIDEAEESLSS